MDRFSDELMSSCFYIGYIGTPSNDELTISGLSGALSSVVWSFYNPSH